MHSRWSFVDSGLKETERTRDEGREVGMVSSAIDGQVRIRPARQSTHRCCGHDHARQTKMYR